MLEPACYSNIYLRACSSLLDARLFHTRCNTNSYLSFQVEDKYLIYDVSFEAVIYCKMRFESYPLDSHVCDFLLSSWIYSEDVLNLTMNSLTFDAENQVSLLDYKPEVRDLAKSKQRKYYVDTYWRIAGFEIVLRRNVHKYIANYYIPSGFLVVVSWVCLSICI